MSLINQVLNELESRGAPPPLGGDTIRAIPPRRESHVLRYVLLTVLLLLILLAAAKWYLERTQTSPLEKSVAMAVPVSVPVLATSGAASATSAASEVAALTSLNMSPVLDAPSPHTSRRNKPLLAVAKEEEHAAAPDVKSAARHKPERIAENAEDSPMESPVNQQLKKISPQQRAENEFRKANIAAQEGRTNDALAGYEAALLADSSHKAARSAWVGMLLSLKRNDDAEKVLQRGLKRDPHETSFAMLLARLQVERGAVPLALETLQKALPYAEGQADYQAFVAALLQRQSRHDDAIAHYQIALKLAPNNGIWLMGMGISLQALQRNEEARAAYQRALASNSLNAQLQAFVQNKLKEL